MKKLFAVLTALCIAVLLLPAAVFAASDDTINAIMYDKDHISITDITYSNDQTWRFYKAGSSRGAKLLGIGDCICSPWDGGYANNSPYTLTIKLTSDAEFILSLDYAFSAHYSSGYVSVDGIKYIDLAVKGQISSNQCVKDHLNQKLSAGSHEIEVYFDKPKSGGDNNNFMAYVYNFTACTGDHSTLPGTVIPPDCYNGGYTDFTCSLCGFSWRADETARLEHEFVDGKCTHCGEYKMEQDESGVYLIKYASQLSQFSRIVNSENSGASAKLLNDIVLNENVLNESGELNAQSRETFTQFTPIGTSETPFTGTFDGDGHTISGLYIYPEAAITQLSAAANNLALCGSALGASIKNVTLKDLYIKGLNYIAGICAQGKNISIENCRVADSRIEASSYASGICAQLGAASSSASSIKSSVNSADVIVSGERAAGIAAYMHTVNLSIENCLNLGEIQGRNSVGGIAGYIYAYPASIKSCLDLGTVSAQTHTGHIVGEYYYSEFTVSACGYAADGTASLGGGSGSGYTNNSFSFSESSLSSGEAAYFLNGKQSENVSWYQTLGEDPYPTPDSSRAKVYAAGDYYTNINCPHTNTESAHVDPTCSDEGFDAKRCSDCGIILKKTSIVPPTGEHSYTNYVCSVCKDGEMPEGAGTEENPLLICNPGNLLWLSQYYNDKLREKASIPEKAYVLVINKINMDLLPAEAEFAPIGSETKPFEGVFDGGCAESDSDIVIGGLRINALDNAGLFGYALNACIKNVSLNSPVIKGGNNVAAIVGAIYSHNPDSVVLSGNSVANGNISGTTNVGGIAGIIGGGIASENAVVKMDLYSSSPNINYIGAIAAENSGIIKDSMSAFASMSAKGTGPSYISGITAYNKNSIENCLSYFCTYNDFSFSGGIVCVGKVPQNSYYITKNTMNSMADGTAATQEQIASGEICYSLNGGITSGIQAWYQDLTKHQEAPTPFYFENCTVYKNNDGYSNIPELILKLYGDELTLRNPAAADEKTKSASIYFAAYKDGVMQSIRRLTVKEDCTIKISELGLDIQNCNSVKIFIWGSTFNPAEKTIDYK